MEGIEWGLGPQDGPGCFAEQGEWGDVLNLNDIGS